MRFWSALAQHRKWAAHVPTEQVAQAIMGKSARPSLVEMLSLFRCGGGRPGGTEWASAFSWFVRACLLYSSGEALTTESVQALASYLARAHARLGGRGAILEVGAGCGRLAHFLNATGLLPVPLVATDPQPRPTPTAPNGAFPVAALDDAAAIAAHAPVALVLCAWMPVGQDWTPRWRNALVAEYVLIGALADDSLPCNRTHPGYERELLRDVSRHMLHHGDADREQIERRGGGLACAVAFRRKAR